MTRQALTEQILKKGSYLCVGLDTDPDRLPPHLLSGPDPVVAFNKAIIAATQDLCVAYKLNTAFYERQGVDGWRALAATVQHIPAGHFIIADAKRGDIGNTALQYARTFFDTYGFDAVTVAPYMGEDSVTPFLNHAGKWAIVLGLTSNAGSRDFQMLSTSGGARLYEKVIKAVAGWGQPDGLMFVVGATRTEQIAEIRRWIPEHFLLVPGVGAQGGDLKKISAQGLNRSGGLLVNASRSILYAGKDEDFATAARQVATGYVEEMTACLQRYGHQLDHR